MELLAPSLAHACILAACADPCLHPGDHHRLRLRPDVTSVKADAREAAAVPHRRKKKDDGADEGGGIAGMPRPGGGHPRPSPPPAFLFGTWLAHGAEIITIGKYQGGATLIYIPSQDTFYFASPSAVLSPECPANTIFVGQFVVDNDATPRILVFDVAKVQNVACAGMPARDRYACLQQRLAHHLGPLCTLQWVGDCRALANDMASGRFTVPHAVRGVVALQPEPGRLALIQPSSMAAAPKQRPSA